MQVDGYNDGTNNAYNPTTVGNPTTVDDHFRQQYFENLDLIISSIKYRFIQPAFTVFLKMEQMLLNILQQKNYSNELAYVKQVYGTDINPVALQTESFSFYTMFKSISVATFDDIFIAYHWYRTSLLSSTWFW